MTASWNSTGEVGWPDDEGDEPRPYALPASDSNWQSFADSLRAHGFEAAPPPARPDSALEAHAEEPQSEGQERTPGAEPMPLPLHAVAPPLVEPAAPDDEAGADIRLEWASADDLDAPVLPGVGSSTERPMSVFGTEHVFVMTGAVFAGPTADDEWPEATIPPTSDDPEPSRTEPDTATAAEPEAALQASSEPGATFPASSDEDEALDLQDDVPADAWTSEHTMQSAEWNAPSDGWDDFTGTTWKEPEPTDGSTVSVDPVRGAITPQTLPDDRLPTPPPELAALLARRRAAATEGGSPTDDAMSDEAAISVADESTVDDPADALLAEPWAAAPADAMAAEPWAEAPSDAMAAEPWVEEPASTPAYESWAEASTDLGAEPAADEPAAEEPNTALAHGSSDHPLGASSDPMSQPAAAAEFVPWSYEDSSAHQPSDDADAAQPAANEPQEDSASDFWAVPLEDQDWSAGAPGDEASVSAASHAEAPDIWAVAVDQDQGWSPGIDGEADSLAAESPAAGAEQAAAPSGTPDWSDWSTVAQGHASDEGAPAAELGSSAEAAADTDAHVDGVDEKAPDAGSPNGVAVDWYEAAAIDAVGTTSADQLSNTEFVGYDERAAEEAAVAATAAAATAAAATTDDHEPGEERPLDGESKGHAALAVAALGATTGADDEWPEAHSDDKWWATDEASSAAAVEATGDSSAGAATDTHDGTTPSDEPSTSGVATTSAAAEPQTSPTPPGATSPGEPDWPKPELADWSAADQDPWVSPTSATARQHDGMPVATAAGNDAPDASFASAGKGASPSTASSPGLFSRYDTPSMAAAGAGTAAATASQRGESDLWHLVSEPAAGSPAGTERRSFDPVTVFLTVLVAIIIVALLLGLLYTVAPLLTGAAH